ncbi:MAG: histidinol-phosphate transaminase [Deltaproteobacteria bacterium]|nr:histidinol-phosphate transaminase [Deltaproteobacteria bacterium]
MAGPRIPERIRSLQPYKPGRPIEEVERELGIRGSIKVASNENPLGPSPLALEALRDALPGIHRYPDGGALVLAEKLAASLGVEPQRIVFGNGSNELLELSCRLFAGPGDEVLFSADAFLVYPLVSIAVGATAVKAPARGFEHDLGAIAARLTPRTRVVFLANPNNPTGTIFRRAEWERFLARVPEDVCVVLDEAYFEYVEDPEYPNGLDFLDRHPGLVVTRTFSKIYGLAGLRIGYGVGSLEVMDALARLRQPFNVNMLAQVAACAALDDDAHVEASRRRVRAGRRRWSQACAALGLDFVPSHANFVLVRVGDGRAVTEALLQRGVIVRPMDAYGFPGHVRVTFGTEAEDERTIAALEAVLAARGCARG